MGAVYPLHRHTLIIKSYYVQPSHSAGLAQGDSQQVLSFFHLVFLKCHYQKMVLVYHLLNRYINGICDLEEGDLLNV